MKSMYEPVHERDSGKSVVVKQSLIGDAFPADEQSADNALIYGDKLI